MGSAEKNDYRRSPVCSEHVGASDGCSYEHTTNNQPTKHRFFSRIETTNQTLLVIVSDRLTNIIKKGEITDRYYNPGELFDEVHILMTNDDRPSPEALQKTVGRAELHLHNLPADRGLFLRSLGWQPLLLRNWVNRGLKLAGKISPSLVRTHGSFVEGYLAREIKRCLGVPYVISLHSMWDFSLASLKEKLTRPFRKKLERMSLENADAVIAVYAPIVPYARKHGAKKVHLIYNAVAGHNISVKGGYKLSSPPRLITVNRQFRGKNPENIIRAVRDIDCHYLIVGDGVYHEYLVGLAKQLGCENKIEFVKAIPNEKLCGMLKDFDLMVSHCDYWGISKTTIEAALAGLPVVLNKHPSKPMLDFDGEWAVLCENSRESYEAAIRKLLASEELRAEYGRRAREHALACFEPARMESEVVSLYQKVLQAGRNTNSLTSCL